MREELAAVEVPSLTGRVGYLVRDGLLDQLNPTGVEVPRPLSPRRQLRERTGALGIQLDNTITRYNLTLVARFSLVDAQHRAHRSIARSCAGSRATTRSRAPYAELSAEQDAERRAAREVSNDIRTQLAIHFARQAEAAPAPRRRPQRGRAVVKLVGGQVERFLRQPDLPVVLVYGPDQGLVRERAERLIAAVLDDPRTRSALSELGADVVRGDPGRLLDEARALCLAGRPPGGAAAPGGRSGDRGLPRAARARAARGAGGDRGRRARRRARRCGA